MILLRYRFPTGQSLFFHHRRIQRPKPLSPVLACSSSIINQINRMASISSFCVRRQYDDTKKTHYISMAIADGSNNKNENSSTTKNYSSIEESKNNSSRVKFESLDGENKIPESVLQYERQMRKLQAADRASGFHISKEKHLRVVYTDNDIVVVNKPSGLLCVPGVHQNPSMLGLVYEEIKPSLDKNHNNIIMKMDQMVVHRLDMDTSGLVVFARNLTALKKMHELFRERDMVKKKYEALVCGHLNYYDSSSSSSTPTSPNGERIIQIDLPIQRDHKFPPFMRIATPQSELEASNVIADLQHNGWKKMVRKKPKPSTTQITSIQLEYLDTSTSKEDDEQKKLPVTRVTLIPVTGRTHQLRVHLAALGHSIVGDPAYGYMGETSPNGGLDLPSDYDDNFSGLKERFSSYHGHYHALQEKIHQTWVQLNSDKNWPPMCLHAKYLKFPHPVTGELMEFECAPSF